MWKKFWTMIATLWTTIFRRKKLKQQKAAAEKHREMVAQYEQRMRNHESDRQEWLERVNTEQITDEEITQREKVFDRLMLARMKERDAIERLEDEHPELIDSTEQRGGIVMPDGTFVEAPEGGFTLNGVLGGDGTNELTMTPIDQDSTMPEKVLDMNTSTVRSADEHIREGNLEHVDLMIDQIIGSSSMERSSVTPNADGTPRGKSSYLRQIDAETFECDLCGTRTTMSDESAYNPRRIAQGVTEYGVIGACYHCEHDHVLEYATALYNKNVNSANRVILLDPKYVEDWATTIHYRSADHDEQAAAVAFQIRHC